MRRSVSCSVRVPSGCDPAAGDERQGGQPEQSPEAGEGSCGTRQQSGAAAGEDVRLGVTYSPNTRRPNQKTIRKQRSLTESLC